MKIKIKCPDCGKNLNVTIEEEKKEVVTFKTAVETETNWLDIVKNKASLKIGDEVSCHLKDNRLVTFVVAAINPYEENQVAFVLKDCFDEFPMADNGTYIWGWNNCDLRKRLNENVFYLLPNDLQNIIKPRKDTNDKLWLLSCKEVLNISDNFSSNDVHFPLFSTQISRIKSNSQGCPTRWWLRSPGRANTFNFQNVQSSGSSYFYNAYYSSGVAFGFFI